MLGQRSLKKQDRGLQPNVYLIFEMFFEPFSLKISEKKNLLVFSVLYYLGYEVYSHLIINTENKQFIIILTT